jgi:Ca2+-dependent lipid-binding protein
MENRVCLLLSARHRTAYRRARCTADAYVTLTFSHLGKPLFSTRIVKEDLNPVFEETAAFPIDVNVLKLGEKLSIQLWDSDRSSAVRRLGWGSIFQLN